MLWKSGCYNATIFLQQKIYKRTGLLVGSLIQFNRNFGMYGKILEEYFL